jgi:hypothetical protein
MEDELSRLIFLYIDNEDLMELKLQILRSEWIETINAELGVSLLKFAFRISAPGE